MGDTFNEATFRSQMKARRGAMTGNRKLYYYSPNHGWDFSVPCALP
jgi:hypothetical protein